jgi:hypothetical protein
MAEKTPTTEDVREAYVISNVRHASDPYNEEPFAAAFDLWLAARDREVAAKAWAEAVAALRYEDGSPVEVVAMVNPYGEEADRG